MTCTEHAYADSVLSRTTLGVDARNSTVEVPPRPGPIDEETLNSPQVSGSLESGESYVWQRGARAMSTSTGAEVAAGHVTKTYPLNSRCLTAETLSRIANASAAETMQLIEGRLGEEHEPRNVQVDLTEVAPSIVEIQLRSSDGVIAEIPAEDRHGVDPEHDDGEPEMRELHAVEEDGGGARDDDRFTSREKELAARIADAEEELGSERDRARELEAELERVQEARQRLEDQLTAEVSRLNDRVREEKERYCTLWRLNCTQLVEYDEALARKDEQNCMLRERLDTLEARMRSVVLPEHADSARVTTSVSLTERVGVGESGGAVVPVSDPGRDPTHPLPSGRRREASSSHACGGGDTTSTVLGEVPVPSPVVSHKGTHPAIGHAR